MKLPKKPGLFLHTGELPLGKPAEKKMPRPEKQKAPDSKAMPRQKAPLLSEETDKALKKLEKATEAKIHVNPL